MSATITAIVTVTATQTIVGATATTTIDAHDAVYFEICWSILSTLGIFTALVGILAIGIVGFSLLALVPIINSVGSAIGNGLCWYAFYSNYSIHAKVSASIAADLGWLLQEASLSFYSFLIVRTLVRGRERIMFHCVFWFLVVAICSIRVAIIASRVVLVKQGSDNVSPSLQKRVNHLHMGYFISIALCESWNAYFLLRKFYVAQKRRESISRSTKTIRDRLTRRKKRSFTGPDSIYARLARSTEIRLALLAVIGICRSITFTFQATAQSATNLPSQLDRFAACFECMFPIVFIVDLLASKLAFSQTTGSSGSNGQPMSDWNNDQNKINVTSEVAVRYHSNTIHDTAFSREELENGSNYSDETKLTSMQPTVTIVSNSTNSTSQYPRRVAGGDDVLPTQPMKSASYNGKY